MDRPVALLTSLAPMTPQTDMTGHTFTWSQGVTIEQTYATGVSRITKHQKMHGAGMPVSNAILVTDEIPVRRGRS